ncbi:PA0069 family radical SAM protein [Limobrevibacterium gyesilva]|uniref:PA0069 family radical SAM protein n=1 Tax=Limobrevibacterium gyesilva TaxID=2991712 RepID=A0AA41YJT5_9PROT|nr:PA0069 family radical SAM protein [Limobrevibacterium gyesilva]MCW3473128.1 PA0069 family radical SAM protein [Limobrevibacterium gyesilva]
MRDPATSDRGVRVHGMHGQNHSAYDDRSELVREIDPQELEAQERAGLPDTLPAPARAARRSKTALFIPPVPTTRPTVASTDGPPGTSVVRKGRGATVNPPNRFVSTAAAPFDDGWDTLAADFTDLPPLPTTLIRDASRSVISWNQSPDIGFDRAVNPYRGCEHGCVYCYARPTHAYLGYSPGLDFETKLLFKPDVAEILEKELRKPGYIARPLALGSNTDPYQPVDRTLKLTRAVLQVLDRFNHPVTIVTKSAGVLRDLDILQPMAERSLVRVCLSVTTLDPALARRMEPRAATPARRLQAIEQLTRAGIPTGVLAAPMIPALNDAEMERILEAASRAGARWGGYVLLRLPHELKQIFEDWLHRHFPDRARHVLELVRETRAGALNDAQFGQRFSGTGVYADLLARRFARAARQWGLDNRAELDCSRFNPPADSKSGRAQAQMSLF